MTLKSKFLAEILGTFVLILFGAGVVAMVVLFSTTNSVANGGYVNITLAWGLAVTFGIYVAGTVSGAHLNPAVTIAMAITKRLPASHVLPYIIAQLIGAFLAAFVVFVVYYAKWIEVDPNLMKTAGIFTTFPAVNNFWSGFIDQIVGTFLLVFVILAITDNKSGNFSVIVAPIAIGFLVVAIGMSFGGMHGYAINPARDFAPRIFAAIAGFSNTGFSDIKIWIVPIIGPILGGSIGALVYDATIGKTISSIKK